jgi:hypothetical protein
MPPAALRLVRCSIATTGRPKTGLNATKQIEASSKLLCNRTLTKLIAAAVHESVVGTSRFVAMRWHVGY